MRLAEGLDSVQIVGPCFHVRRRVIILAVFDVRNEADAGIHPERFTDSMKLECDLKYVERPLNSHNSYMFLLEWNSMYTPLDGGGFR